MDALALVHTVDWRALGIEPPDAPQDYVAKQLRRWLKARATDSVRDLPLIAEVGGLGEGRELHLWQDLLPKPVPPVPVPGVTAPSPTVPPP